MSIMILFLKKPKSQSFALFSVKIIPEVCCAVNAGFYRVQKSNINYCIMPVFSLCCVNQQAGTKTKSSDYAEYDYFTELTGWHKISKFGRCTLS